MSTIKLTEIIAVWDILHIKDTGEIGYCDLQNALERVGVTVINDVSGCQPRKEVPDA